MSFRVRLFVSAIASVTVVLGIVMATAWVRVMDLETSRLNTRLCSEAARLAREEFTPRELRDIEADIARKLGLAGSAYVLVQQTSPQGKTVFQSEPWSQTVPEVMGAWTQQSETALAPPPPPGSGPGPAQADARTPAVRPPARCEVASFQHGNRAWQIARISEGDAVGQVAADLEASQTEIRIVLWAVLRTVLPLALILSGIAAWMLSSSLIKPIQRLRASMRSVTPTDMGARLATSGEDREFTELITSYNTMLERLERSFHQASRFSADAAHELKTPLTVLRGNIERLRRKTSDAEAHAQLSDLLDEVSRLAAITRKLLLLSQADAGKLELQGAEVDLTKLLQELMEDARMAGEGKVLQSDIANSLETHGDVVLLRQMFNNLISNALRYASDKGRVTLTAFAKNGRVEVQVFNTCPPIPPTARVRFFERFFRGEDVQSRKIDGSGLGLCLALEIARAHHGTLALMPSTDTEVLLVVNLPSLPSR